MSVRQLRSKYVVIKTYADALDPSEVVEKIQKDYPDCAVVWARHPGKSPHDHYVVRFAMAGTTWTNLRNWLMQRDPHSYSQVGRMWTRSVRYLLHLDNPEKEPIPRDNLMWAGEIDEDEIHVLLGAPRASLLGDLQHLPDGKTATDAVDWLVNERGHGPGEVAAMVRCLMAVAEYRAVRRQLVDLQPVGGLVSSAAAPQVAGVSAVLPGDLDESDALPLSFSDFGEDLDPEMAGFLA